MRRQINLPGFSLILFTAFALIVSCSNGGDDKKAADESGAVGKDVHTSSLTPGVLDVLWTDSTAFNTIPNGSKLIFSFVFKMNDTLTLGGWVEKKPYDDYPNIVLTKGKAVAGVEYGYGTYFGDVVLQQSDVNAIKQDIKGTYKYILFTPEKYKTNSIQYKISYSNVEPSLMEASAQVMPPANIYANPSPPKDY